MEIRLLSRKTDSLPGNQAPFPLDRLLSRKTGSLPGRQAELVFDPVLGQHLVQFSFAAQVPAKLLLDRLRFLDQETAKEEVVPGACFAGDDDPVLSFLDPKLNGDRGKELPSFASCSR